MSARIDLIALDLDGTLLDRDGEVGSLLAWEAFEECALCAALGIAADRVLAA